MAPRYPESMSRVVVTGANSGLGFEACLQLARDYQVPSVILSCRSQAKADAAIASLVEKSGRSKDVFSSVLMDMSDLDSCVKAAQSISGKVDGVIMNAGGMYVAKNFQNKDDLNAIFVCNVLGHAAFLEKLIADGKLNADARVVFGGSELARGFDLMKVKRPEYASNDKEGVLPFMKANIIKDEMKLYAHAKLIGALYLQALSKEHPEYSFLTVSPGWTPNTAAAADANFIMRFMFTKVFPFLYKSQNHPLEVGTDRYMQGLFPPSVTNKNKNNGTRAGNDRIETEGGKFYAGVKKIATGKLADQSSFDDRFTLDTEENRNLRTAVAELVRSFLPKSSTVTAS